MQFLTPGLFVPMIVATLVALPILIHMINLMRYRRVQWAAMEFVLASHKKSSTWILLKQLLLLLLRILALLALLAILAQMVYKADLSHLFSGVTTHHVVVIDDTASSSDRSVGKKTPLEVAKAEALTIGKSAAESPGRHTFTLLTYSDAKHTKFLFNQRLVDPEFPSTLENVLSGIRPTELAVSPQPVLDAIKTLERAKNEKRRLWILSDFRAHEWGVADDLNAQFDEMGEDGTVVNLVQCIDVEHGNLTISSLKPKVGAMAAGISIIMEVAVTNYGKSTKNEVSIVRKVDDQTLSPIRIGSIRPGETKERSFEVEFDRPGMHQVTVELQAKDAIAADNVRHAAVEVQEGIPVLIVDGILASGDAPELSDGFYISTALKPSVRPGEYQTGIVPEIVSPQFLNNPRVKLRKYQGIFLCNFDRLSEAAVTVLEEYVANGGGLAIFAGELFNPRWVNARLYSNGEGLYPVKLAAEVDLIVDRLAEEKPPDMDPDVEHPVFRVFGGGRGKFLNEIALWKYYAVAKDWQPAEKSTVKVVVELRNKAPLVVEHTYGKNGGRVMAFLTTAGPFWNDWSKHPTYPVLMLELRNYLSPPPPDYSQPLGTEISASYSPDIYSRDILWRLPDRQEKREMEVNLETGMYDLPVPDISRSGIYELHLTTLDQKTEITTYVFNVDPDEGNLALVGSEKLHTIYNAESVKILQPGAIVKQIDDSAHSNLSELLLYCLIFLLICEQMLAYSASYHPPAMKGVA